MEDIQDEFSFTLVSNRGVDLDNSSFQFRTPFAKQIDLRGYEVALQSITYQDYYQKPQTTNNLLEETAVFFDIDNEDNLIHVTDIAASELVVTKNETEFDNFLTVLNTTLQENGMNISLIAENEIVNEVSEILKITLRVNVPSGFAVIVSEPLKSILGIESRRLYNGSTVGAKPDLSSFDLAANDTELGQIVILNATQSSVSIEQYEAPPTLSSLLGDITGALDSVGAEATFILNKRFSEIRWDLPGLVEVTFSDFLNKYLGLPPEYRFRNSGSFRVDRRLHFPQNMNPLNGERFQPITCSKILVMCNLIQNQFYCGKPQKILAILDRKENDKFTRYEWSASQMVYKQVFLDMPTYCQITLESDNNEFLPFSSEPTVVTLNFRKRFVV